MQHHTSFSFSWTLKQGLAVKKLNVIANSMGSRGLVDALEGLKINEFYEEFVFNQIILAAPDIDAQIFVEQIAPQLLNCSNRLTLYASSRDTLLASKVKRLSSVPRAGDSHESKFTPVSCLGVDTIDVSDLPTSSYCFSLGYSYYAELRDLINDIYNLIRFGHEPKDRNLIANTKGPSLFWKFRR
ncbi:alpha/beta hydrolase [Chitinophaga sp. LS1]|uniref:alpha/beta hydrolase n=1 Tax=Chitinophaga sp. LS1 TaxID=3051176 RepID=UPI002AAB94E3|nr:alpha/beta hydrolase [Chitinophaga sp. LS1]WPV64002.1 alpha/beta hydrolase [Chitinophaga sp. LS1]